MVDFCLAGGKQPNAEIQMSKELSTFQIRRVAAHAFRHFGVSIFLRHLNFSLRVSSRLLRPSLSTPQPLRRFSSPPKVSP